MMRLFKAPLPALSVHVEVHKAPFRFVTLDGLSVSGPGRRLRDQTDGLASAEQRHTVDTCRNVSKSRQSLSETLPPNAEALLIQSVAPAGLGSILAGGVH